MTTPHGPEVVTACDPGFIIPLRKNKTIFGKDQRTPATGYISYPTLSASKRIISGPWVHRNVPFHIKGGMKKYIVLC